jgi:Chaperone of endosialidase
VGNLALAFSGTGSANVALGSNAGSNVTTASNVITIGTNVAGANVSNTCFIGNIFGVNVGMDALPVSINANGQLGTTVSSRRFKKDIKPMEMTSESILALKPVTFHYKNDSKGTRQFGLIAEEVAEVNPDLVVRDKDGEIYSVRYDQVNAMLLNEFLKQHKKVEAQSQKIEEQETRIAQLTKDLQIVSAEHRKEIEVLTAQMKEQAAQIQKVNARMEITERAPQTAVNYSR